MWLPGRVHRADLRWFRRVAQGQTPVLDPVLPRLTRAANHSKLWAVIAAVLGFAGGRFGRRAGLRGLFGIAVTSLVTNVPMKLLWRRTRPSAEDVPLIRRLKRLPASSSFPSGHAASAFAFATGVAQERPKLAVPMYTLAGAVAFSRVYTGVHYPSDVIAGAALGTGMALLTRRFWPVAPDEPARVRPADIDVGELPDSDGTGLVIVVNPGAGSGFSEPPTEALREALPGAEVIEIDDKLPLVEALEKAAASGRAIGVAGGDGTVNAAAQVAHDREKPLVVVPGGTLNHFARELGLSTIDDVVAAVRDGHAVGVDLGQIAGHPFLNTASLGAYVDLVDARERLENTIGKWPAVVVALARVLRRAEPVDVVIDGERVRIWMAFIGNCRYHPAGFTPSWRDRLDDGVLDVRLVKADEPFARLRLLWAVLTGTLSRSRVYSTDVVRGPFEVQSSDGPIRLARDGETFDGPAEFEIRKSRDPLVVLTPAAASEPR